MGMKNYLIIWKQSGDDGSYSEIPRCYFFNLSDAKDVQLHTFVDAGDSEYATICYLRVQKGRTIDISLVAAKSKVTPLKPISVTRFKLHAAILGVRLSMQVQGVYRIPIRRKVYWTDSSMVLKCLKMDPKQFRQFVMFYEIWFNGPSFLTAGKNDWPYHHDFGSTNKSEIKHHTLQIQKFHQEKITINFEYFSS